MKTSSRYLMIIHNRFQLLQTIHIKKTFFNNDEVDAILVSDQIDYGYVERLKKVFDCVFWMKADYYTRKERLLYYFFPSNGLKKAGILKPDCYTDIYFWNPGAFYYYLRRYEIGHKLRYKWHILQDAQGNYLFNDKYGQFTNYPDGIIGKFMKLLDYNIWKIGLDNSIDEYLWKPELRMIKSDHEIFEIPSIDTSDSEYLDLLNYIYEYEPLTIENKYIYVDTAHGFVDDSVTYRIIRELGERITPDRITIIPHPGEDISEYDSVREYADIIEPKVPWELVCMNQGEIGNKVFIGCISSALYFPMVIIKDFKCEIFSFSQVVGYDKVHTVDFFNTEKLFYLKLENELPRFHNVKSIDEIIKFISDKTLDNNK